MEKKFENLFFFLGVPKIDDIPNNIQSYFSQIKPQILYSYSSPESTLLKEELKNRLSSDENLLFQIFPEKSNKIIENIKKDSYGDPIIDQSFSEKFSFNYNKVLKNLTQPENIFIFFPYEDYTEGIAGIKTEVYINCYIFYEEVNKKEDRALTNQFFIPQVFIIVSTEANGCLYKNILEWLYKKSKTLLEFPLEIYVMNLIDNLNNLKANRIIKNECFKYSYNNNPLFYPCDLNYAFFFSIMSFSQFLHIAQAFFNEEDIIILSPYQEVLYPIYRIFLSLVYPFQTTFNPYTYKNFNPSNVEVLGANERTSLILSMYSDPLNTEKIKTFMGNNPKVLVLTIFRENKHGILKSNLIQYELKKILIVKKKWEKKEILPEKHSEFEKHLLKIYTAEIALKEINALIDLKFSKKEYIKPMNIFNIEPELKEDFSDLRQRCMGLMLIYFTSITEDINFNASIKSKKILFETEIIPKTPTKKQIRHSQDFRSQIEQPMFKNFIFENFQEMNALELKVQILLQQLVTFSRLESGQRCYYQLLGKPIKTREEKQIDIFKNSREFKENYYLNKVNKFILRNGLEKNKVLQIKYIKDKYYFEYSHPILNTEKYNKKRSEESLINNEPNKANPTSSVSSELSLSSSLLSKEDPEYYFYNEAVVFYFLYENNCLPYKKDEEIKTALIAFLLCLYIYYQIQQGKENEYFMKEFRFLEELMLGNEFFSQIYSFLLSFYYTLVHLNKTLFERKNIADNIIENLKVKPTICLMILKSENEVKELKPFLGQKEFKLYIDQLEIKEEIGGFKAKIKIGEKEFEVVEKDNNYLRSVFEKMIFLPLLNRCFDFEDLNNLYDNWINDYLQIVVMIKRKYGRDLFMKKKE